MPNDQRTDPGPDLAAARFALDDAMANMGYGGREPSPEMLADLDAVANGTMALAEAIAGALASAQADDEAAWKQHLASLDVWPSRF